MHVAGVEDVSARATAQPPLTSSSKRNARIQREDAQAVLRLGAVGRVVIAADLGLVRAEPAIVLPQADELVVVLLRTHALAQAAASKRGAGTW